MTTTQNTLPITSWLPEYNTGWWIIFQLIVGPGGCGTHFNSSFFQLMLQSKLFSTFYEIALRYMPQNRIDVKSATFQVIAWCHQMTSHYLAMARSYYLRQYWLRSTVWYKTKFGSQNFGYQCWCLFLNICNVFKNMFNVGLMIML